MQGHYLNGESKATLNEAYLFAKWSCEVRGLEFGWKRYKEFRVWAKNNGYQPGMALTRIDKSETYCPENCRWK